MLALLKVRFHKVYQPGKRHDTRIVEDIDSTDADGEKGTTMKKCKMNSTTALIMPYLPFP